MTPIGEAVAEQDTAQDTSIMDFVGATFGDVASDAGSPVESTETPDPEMSPDATLDSIVADPAPEAGAREGTPPDSASPEPADPDVDPLSTATALTYTVDGQSKTYDGIKVLGNPEDGAWVDPTALPDLQRRLGERDHLVETNQRQHQSLAALDALSHWSVTDDQGKEIQRFSGAEGLIEMRATLAQTLAENSLLVEALTNPERFASLIHVTEDNKILPSASALEFLLARVDAARMKSEQQARTAMQQWRTERVQQAQAPTDFTAQAPQMLESVITAAGIPGTSLTASDRTSLQTQLLKGPYLRPANAAEVQANPSLKGQTVIDPSFVDVVRMVGAQRAEAQTTLGKTVQTTQAAATVNARRLAAATRGKAPQAPQKPVPPPTADPSGDKWDFLEQTARRATR